VQLLAIGVADAAIGSGDEVGGHDGFGDLTRWLDG
jgi:hypothetical protein